MSVSTPLPDVTFQPWRGKGYCEGKPRLMILGESHYDWSDRTDPEHSVTTTVVKLWGIEKRSSFFTKIAALCTGEIPRDAEARRDFWESVAFYNYIQVFVGDAPRKRPDSSMRPRSEQAFRTVLAELRPQIILVLGRQNWENMPELGGMAGEPLTSLGNPYSYTWLYPTAAGEHALAFHVRHPSAPGFNFRRFIPLFNEARSRAIERLTTSVA